MTAVSSYKLITYPSNRVYTI